MKVKTLSVTDMCSEVCLLLMYVGDYGATGSLEEILEGFRRECRYAHDVKIDQLEVSHLQQLIDMGILCYDDMEVGGE